jgi:hypothetical protein
MLNAQRKFDEVESVVISGIDVMQVWCIFLKKI